MSVAIVILLRMAHHNVTGILLQVLRDHELILKDLKLVVEHGSGVIARLSSCLMSLFAII